MEMVNDESALPQILTDDEIQALVDANLYEFDGEHDDHATPNYRYCKPETPCYQYDFDEAIWKQEGVSA